MSVMETYLIAMSHVVRKEGKVKALYEILIYFPRGERLRERGFISDILGMLLWLMQIISLKSMEHNRNYYYDISKRFLWMVGQWPYQKPKTRLSFLALVVIILANCLFTQVILSTRNIFWHLVSMRFIYRCDCYFWSILYVFIIYTLFQCMQIRFSDSKNFCMRRHTVYFSNFTSPFIGMEFFSKSARISI